MKRTNRCARGKSAETTTRAEKVQYTSLSYTSFCRWVITETDAYQVRREGAERGGESKWHQRRPRTQLVLAGNAGRACMCATWITFTAPTYTGAYTRCAVKPISYFCELDRHKTHHTHLSQRFQDKDKKNAPNEIKYSITLALLTITATLWNGSVDVVRWGECWRQP